MLRSGAHGVLISLVPGLLAAQSPATGVVAGHVRTRADSGVGPPLRGATIAVLSTTLRRTSDVEGRFVFDAVPPGLVTFRVTRAGYRSLERSIRISSGDTVRVELALEPEAQLLPAVRASALATDVETFESKPSVGTITLGKAAMTGVPRVGEPDVVRVVQLLPGVVARNDFTTGLNVRGGEADQNLVLLDGHPIYNPFHLG